MLLIPKPEQLMRLIVVMQLEALANREGFSLRVLI